MQTRLTELLGIKYPIIQPAMGWVADEHLVAAVCNAGGLGFLPTVGITPEEQRQKIRWIKERIGNKPFGLNAHPIVPRYRDYIDMWIEEKVPVWGSAFRSPFRLFGIQKPKDLIYIPTVGAPRHAMSMEREGADAVIAHCMEGGGHAGGIAATVFIPKVSESVKIPVIAAGGFCDGKGLVGALAMGAEGVAMGTRFAITKECSLALEVKLKYLKDGEADVRGSYVFDGFFLNAIEGDKIKNYRGWWTHPWDIIPDFLHMKKKLGASLGQMIAMARFTRSMRVSLFQNLAGAAKQERGIIRCDFKRGLFPAGQVVGRINDIPTCSELIERMMQEAEETVRALGLKFAAPDVR